MTDSRPIKWADPAVPRSVVQFIVVSRMTKKVLLMHRSALVRSAANCWSFPSGLHEIGDTVEQTIAREMLEELSLDYCKLNGRTHLLGVYENIAGDTGERPQYHWVILMYAVLVDSVEDMRNLEPDKHDMIIDVEPEDLYEGNDVCTDLVFHSTLSNWLRANRTKVETLGALSALR